MTPGSVLRPRRRAPPPPPSPPPPAPSPPLLAMLRSSLLVFILPVVLLAPAASASAMASHDGWPPTSMLVMNKTDRDRPLDARPGLDPFGGKDPNYRCDSI